MQLASFAAKPKAKGANWVSLLAGAAEPLGGAVAAEIIDRSFDPEVRSSTSLRLVHLRK